MKPYAIAGVILIVSGAILSTSPAAVGQLFVYEGISAFLRVVSYAGVFLMAIGVLVGLAGIAREWLKG